MLAVLIFFKTSRKKKLKQEKYSRTCIDIKFSIRIIRRCWWSFFVVGWGNVNLLHISILKQGQPRKPVLQVQCYDTYIYRRSIHYDGCNCCVMRQLAFLFKQIWRTSLPITRHAFTASPERHYSSPWSMYDVCM